MKTHHIPWRCKGHSKEHLSRTHPLSSKIMILHVFLTPSIKRLSQILRLMTPLWGRPVSYTEVESKQSAKGCIANHRQKSGTEPKRTISLLSYFIPRKFCFLYEIINYIFQRQTIKKHIQCTCTQRGWRRLLQNAQIKLTSPMHLVCLAGY